ncbi:MAG: oxidoreductase domain protein [Ilumatobacteraceae bacterium]|nr:oxidoreductase domain protein [Ilumatobacteraceae bacterium]
MDTTATTPLRWGAIGSTSRIYRNALAPAFAASDHHVVVAEASRANGSERPYADLLARDDIDAVYIPLPNNGHRPWILAALAAGKHVLCEKPLTMSAADTAEVFDAAEAAGRVLMEAYMWPHHPRARRIMQLVHDGAIGEVNAFRSVFTYPASNPADHRFDERGAGALFDVGIYCLAPPMLMLDRDPVAVAAAATRNAKGIDVAMTGFVDWGRGVGSNFDVSFQAPQRRILEITGTDGILTVPGQHTPGPETASQILIQRRDDAVEVIDVEGASAFVGMVDQFAAVVRGQAPAVFGRRESVRLARLLDRLHAASAASDPNPAGDAQ